MTYLKGKSIFLRALEPSDIDFLFAVENDVSLWHISQTVQPFSRHILEAYIESAKSDIYEAKQLRLVICEIESNNLCGFIDLFDFDPRNNRAGVGIVVAESFRKKGIASEALELLITYAFEFLNLFQLYACVEENNQASLTLFSKFGFEKTGVRKQWNWTTTGFQDEIFLQLIQHNHV